MKSKFMSLNWHDLKKGLLIAVLTPVLVELQSVLATGSFGVGAVHLAAIGASGLVAYLLKNLFEGEDKQPVVTTAKAGVEDEEVVSVVGCRPNDRG